MKLLDLSLRHIIIFNSVAETLNMGKSADHLFITQSAVSQAIGSIESKFSLRLFLRRNKRLYLTQEGRELYEYTSKAVKILNDAQLYLENIKNKTLNTLLLDEFNILVKDIINKMNTCLESKNSSIK